VSTAIEKARAAGVTEDALHDISLVREEIRVSLEQ